VTQRNKGGRLTRDETARRAVAKELKTSRDMLPAMLAKMRELVLTGGPSVAVQAEQSLARLEARAERELERSDAAKPQGEMAGVHAMLHELCLWKMTGIVRAEGEPVPAMASMPIPELVATLAARREEVQEAEREIEAKLRRIGALEAAYLSFVETRPLGLEPAAPALDVEQDEVDMNATVEPALAAVPPPKRYDSDGLLLPGPDGTYHGTMAELRELRRAGKIPETETEQSSAKRTPTF
jgi:hypothetical protein